MPYLLLSLSALFWSGNFVLSRGMNAVIPPLGLSFWRWAVALVILLPFAFPHFRRQFRDIIIHKKFMFIQGLLGVTGFNTLIYLALQTTTAINAVLVNSCIPVFIVVASWILYRERISIRQGVGILISLGGVMLIIAKGDVSALTALAFNRGDLLVFLAACVWATYSANLKKYPKELHPLAYLLGITIIGLSFIFPLYLWEIQTGRTVVFDMPSLLTIGYVALFASVLAFIFWNRSVREVGANKAGPFVHLMPVFSTILAVTFLNESLMIYHMKGILFIFIGILLTTINISKS